MRARPVTAVLRAAALALPLVLTSCGTTVPLTSSGGTAEGVGLPEGGTQLGDPQGVPAPGSLPATSLKASDAAAGTTSSTSSAAAGAGGPGSSTPLGTYGGKPKTSGPAGPVEIGVELLDMQEGLSLAGSAGNCDEQCTQSFSFDQDTMIDAVVSWANAHGGLAGRQIKLVKYTAKFADFVARGNAPVQAEACAFWTKDHHVSALVLPNVVNDDLVQCAVKNDLPFINGDYAQYVPDHQDLKAGGRYDYASANFNADDAARYYVDALVEQGFLTPQSRVGLVYKETPAYLRTIKDVLKPELAKHGITLAATGGWTDGTAGDTNTWTQYAVAFNSKGVDRVLGYGGWSFGLAGFGKAAENQKYYPRYGVSSSVGPVDLNVQGMPKTQLKGAVGVGWWTFADIFYEGNADSFNPAAKLCGTIMRGVGQPWTKYTYRNAMKFCDNIFLLKALADRAGEVSQKGFYAAADTLGDAFVSPYTWRSTFRPGDHHGATYLRNLVWDEKVDGFAYVGKMYLPHW